MRQADTPLRVVVLGPTASGKSSVAMEVAERLGGGYVDLTIDSYPGNGKLLSILQERAEIVSQDYPDDRHLIHCRMPKRFVWLVEKLEGVTVTGAQAAIN